MDTIKIVAIVGLIFIIIGNILITRKKQIRRLYVYPALILGGICLLVYSIYIKDTIFIILQSVFIIASIYGLIKLNERHAKKVVK